MTLSPDSIHETVREYYGERARNSDSCCGPSAGCNNDLYDASLISELPADVSSFTLGCGDPITLASLRPGETVLDLGSGGGLDCFLAARYVGPTGRAIGVDMTPEMLAKANAIAQRLNVTNVEFRKGYLENLPVEDASVDVVISNCVINLSPDKPQVFREIFRALKPGGRVAVSDIVTNGQLPDAVQKSMEAWGACIAGALDVNDYVRGLREAGFTHVRVQPKGDTDSALASLPIGVPFSAAVTATKPKTGEVVAEAEETIITLSAAGGGESRQTATEQLMSRVAEVTSIDGGYELVLKGEPVETRALAEAFIAKEASCCSALHFDLENSADGVRVRLTGGSAAKGCC